MKTIILFFSLFFIISCDNDDDSSSQSIEMSFIEIGKGQLSGNGQEGISQSNFAINSLSSWQNLIAQMDSYDNVSNTFSETSIDFDNYTVIAVFDTIRPHSGYSIQVDNIIEELEYLTINYSEQSSSDGFAVIIQPFHIIEISKTNKDIIFEN